MIKAIIFDYGNVIWKWNNHIFLDKIVKKSNKSYEYIDNFIFLSGLQDKFELGEISEIDFFRIIKEQCNLSITRKEFFKEYTDRLFEKISSTTVLIKKLKKDYKVALLSNTTKVDFDYLIKKLREFSLFDSVTLSFELGFAKPDKGIYLDALKKLNLRPDECIYIDDIKEYSDAASKLGIRGIHYTSYENLIKELKKLNVKV
ncbi:HAD family phosphatase [Candidatus Woesearchaeota archaeon]|nr:HAD family phosphatase [Candidatus Woesearchaeota archaeon]